MGEKKKSNLGCTLGCLGLSLVAVGATVVVFGGIGAAGLAWFAITPQEAAGQEIADALSTQIPVMDSVDAGSLHGDSALADEGDADADAEDQEDAVDEEDASADKEERDGTADASAPLAPPPSSSSSRSTTSSSSGTPRSTTSSSTSSGSHTRPSSSSASSSSGASGTPEPSEDDYEFPEPEPDRPSTKVTYPPVNERRDANRSKSWNVRTEGSVSDVRLAVDGGAGTYPVPGLLPEGKYRIEANFGDGRYVQSGKITVKEGAKYFIQCKPNKQKCSVR